MTVGSYIQAVLNDRRILDSSCAAVNKDDSVERSTLIAVYTHFGRVGVCFLHRRVSPALHLVYCLSVLLWQMRSPPKCSQ